MDSRADQTLEIPLRIDPSQAGTYFTVPFQVPADVERLTVAYRYPRHTAEPVPVTNGMFEAATERNIIDLGLIGPDGRQLGASGSDKTVFSISETEATPGYRRAVIGPGEYRILVGAYRVQPEGVDVLYTVRFAFKSRRLFLGDVHVHTLASDGVHTAAEIALKAKRNGLDFVAITDHNQTVSRLELAAFETDGVTLVPGVEWTHFSGHANFLGAERDFEVGFAVNAETEVRERFAAAKAAGFTVGVNHPCDENVPFRFDLNGLPFDYLEIWNGPMRAANLRALAAWDDLLRKGKRIAAWGGSDYHRDSIFRCLGGPTAGVYAESRGCTDLLTALKNGAGFITFEPTGPAVDLRVGETGIGGRGFWRAGLSVDVSLARLRRGDLVRIVTADGPVDALAAESDGSARLEWPLTKPGYVRAEVLRSLVPGLPPLPVLISNPIWIDG